MILRLSWSSMLTQEGRRRIEMFDIHTRTRDQRQQSLLVRLYVGSLRRQNILCFPLNTTTNINYLWRLDPISHRLEVSTQSECTMPNYTITKRAALHTGPWLLQMCDNQQTLVEDNQEYVVIVPTRNALDVVAVATAVVARRRATLQRSIFRVLVKEVRMSANGDRGKGVWIRSWEGWLWRNKAYLCPRNSIIPEFVLLRLDSVWLFQKLGPFWWQGNWY